MLNFCGKHNITADVEVIGSRSERSLRPIEQVRREILFLIDMASFES